MKRVIFRIRYWLMPEELKKGSWILMDGNATNINEMWRKTRKGWKFECYFHLPTKGEKEER